MDVLSTVLRTLRVHGATGFAARLRAPWGVAIPSVVNVAPFYLVSAGEMLLELQSPQQSIRVRAGELVMLPHGESHSIRDAERSAVRPIRELLGTSWPSAAGQDREWEGRAPRIEHGGGGETTEIVSGTFWFGSAAVSPLLRAFDRVVHIRQDRKIASDFEALAAMSCREVHQPTQGSEFLISEILKLLFLQIARASLERSRANDEGCPSNPLVLSLHPQMRDVAEAIVFHPERNWTVAELARMAAMSRTSFSKRFTEITGLPPLSYLTKWRIVKTVEMLEESNATLDEIAQRVGYGSEAALSIAFKRELGVAPGRYRRAAATRGRPA